MKAAACSLLVALAASPASAFVNSTTFGDVAPLVVGGQEAPIGQYTWTVGLRKSAGGSSGCGGSLISPTWVLTAGHCVAGGSRPSFVAVGTHYLQGTADGEQISVKRIVSHPSYSDPTVGNDVALIELSRASKFAPIKLSKKVAADGESVRLLGWGQTSGPTGSQSSVLKQNDFAVVGNAECQRRVRASNTQGLTNWVAGPTHLCAGGVVGQSSCFGDSGGPLVRLNGDGSASLVGDVSFGVPCAKGVPDQYGRISAFVDFIDRNAKGHQWDDAPTPSTSTPSTSGPVTTRPVSPSPGPTTSTPKPPVTPTPGPVTGCGDRRNVCYWPLTGQTVPYNEAQCAAFAGTFVWCP